MSDCVLWTGATNGRYGQRRVNGKVVYVHRHAWEQVHGPIPPGLTIDHLCEAKLCMNVEHMELVTRAENTRRTRRALCRRGHSMDDAYVFSNGERECRQCRAIRNRAHYLKMKGHHDTRPV